MQAKKENIVVGQAPGWIFCGTVVERKEREDGSLIYLVLDPAAWIEGVDAPWTEAIYNTDKITRFNRLRRPLKISGTGYLWETEAPPQLIAKAELDAIKNSK